MKGNSPTCRTALLTPAGRGAIATVAVVGDAATQRVLRFFQPAWKSARGAASPEFEFSSDRIVYGTWTSPDDQCGEELVVRFLGPQRVEVHCHGGDWAAERILRALESTGCVREHDRFALSFDPELDRIAQQALRSLSQTASLRTAAYLLEQYHGALRSELTVIYDAALRQRGDEVVARLEQLDQLSEFGRHLTDPWRIVIAGPPNAGKSTLLNALLGFPRALVHHEAGTTRDLLEENSLIDGWPVVICDAAGIRDTPHAIELAGIELARQAIETADLLIVVSDARERSEGMLRPDFQAPRTIRVANKCDLPEHLAVADHAQELPVSALLGQGLPALIELIAKKLVPVPPPSTAPIPFTPPLAETVRNALLAARHQKWPVVAQCLASWLTDMVPDEPPAIPDYFASGNV